MCRTMVKCNPVPIGRVVLYVIVGSSHEGDRVEIIYTHLLFVFSFRTFSPVTVPRTSSISTSTQQLIVDSYRRSLHHDLILTLIKFYPIIPRDLYKKMEFYRGTRTSYDRFEIGREESDKWF